MQILLYAPTTSPRLQYICRFILKELLQVDFLIVTSLNVIENYIGPILTYTNETISNDHFNIGNCGLLLETNIKEQDIRCFEVNNYKAFFKTENSDFPFDIFSASFYLLSRYEEYLPHKNDMYGRYAHENSLAFKEDFLHLPLINIWAKHFKELIQKKFPAFSIHHPIAIGSQFTFLPTYDIDMAFSYRHKGILRNIGGFIKSPSFSRIKVLFGKKKDPFDSFDWLDELHKKYNLQPIYFFLMAKVNGVYDKNILPHKKIMGDLIGSHSKTYPIGIHPSWQSGDNPVLIAQEKGKLATLARVPITKSRQHYIRLSLPESYRILSDTGITDDYSMGYGSINGFRASVANSFYWYDLQKNEGSLLRIHPFCFMEANSFYEQKYSPSEAYHELMEYYSICKETGGQMITVWHNNFLGKDPQFTGWSDVYSRFIAEIKK